MSAKPVFQTFVVALLVIGPWLTACSPAATPTRTATVAAPAPTADASVLATAAAAPPSGSLTATAAPDWYAISLTDVRTGQPFTIADFSGKVVLIETMAQWCPNCLFQQGETRKMRQQLSNPPDLILVSLDVDSKEDAASLKDYTDQYGFDWRSAVAPLLVARALGNLYSAEYLNPPLDPMLLIDRHGVAHQLAYGLKQADDLKMIVEPYLVQ